MSALIASLNVLPTRSAVRQARNLSLVMVGAIACAMFTFGSLRYEHFASTTTVTNLLGDYAFVGIAAVGMTFVILAGGIDLSVGSMIAFSSILIASLVKGGWHPLAAATLALAIGAAWGAVMGAVTHLFRLPSFMVTLAGMFAIRAAGFLVHEQSIGIRHEFYTWVSRDATIWMWSGASVPLRSMIFAAVFVLGAVLLRCTAFGHNVKAIGGSPRSARLMGVRVGSTTVGVFALSGFCAALAGFVFTLYQRSGDPAGVVGLELDVIAAVVIGGTLLSGGVGGLAGTLIGIVILGLIRTIIDFEGSLNAAWTGIATGGLLLVFVALQRLLGTLGNRTTR